MRRYRIILVTSILTLSLSLPVGVFGFEDWVPNFDDKTMFLAVTANTAGHIFGQYCYIEEQYCIYAIAIGINCKPGNEYPALINSDAGSGRVTLVCGGKVEDQHVLGVSGFDDIDRVVRKATRFGIAIPMKNDEFKVGRFSLRGAAETIDFMRTVAEKKMKGTPQNRSRPAEERI